MSMTVIGSHLCPDTLFALMQLKSAGVSIDFQNISASFPALKEFLRLRDENPLWIPVKKAGGLGIPCFCLEDGTVTLNLNEALEYVSK